MTILHSHKTLTLRLLVNQTNHTCHVTALIRETIFLPIKFFSSLSHNDSSFMGGSDVSHQETSQEAKFKLVIFFIA